MYVSVHIDEDEVLSNIDDDVLEAELRRRKAPLRPASEVPPIAEANATLDDVAFFLRQKGKIALAWRIDEIRHDYFTVKF